MADPLSVTASVAALLQMTGNVINYLNAAKSAPDEIKRLNLELCTLRGLLSTLQDDLTGLDSSSLDLLEGPSGVFIQIEMLLERMMSNSDKDLTKKFGKFLRWPLQKEEVKDLLACLERSKTSLSVILQNHQRSVEYRFRGFLTDIFRVYTYDLSSGIAHLEKNAGVFKSALEGR